MSTWAPSNFALPGKAWSVIDRRGLMVINPVSKREFAERLAGEYVVGTYLDAKRQGLRVVQIEIREVDESRLI